MKRILSIIVLTFSLTILSIPVFSAGPFPTTPTTSIAIDNDGDGTREFTCNGSTCEFDVDDDGTTEFTVSTTGTTFKDVSATGDNYISIFDNDTDVTPDPTCANKGTSGKLTIIDADEAADDDWTVCDGTNAVGVVGSRVSHTFYANNADVGDADNECMAASYRADSSQACNVANAQSVGVPIANGGYADRLTCGFTAITGTAGAGDIFDVYFVNYDDVTGVSNSTCTVQVDLTDTAPGFQTSECDFEAFDDSATSFLSLRIDFTDADVSATDVDVICTFEYFTR